jgi:hypothetical protein
MYNVGMKSRTARALKLTSCLAAASSLAWLLGAGSCTRNVEMPWPPPDPPPPRAEEPAAVPAAAGGSAPQRATGPDNARSVVGYNLDYPGDWTGLPPFIDFMKNARVWQGSCAEIDPDCDPLAHLSLDERGWVKSLAYRDQPDRAYERIETVVLTNKHQPGCDGELVLDYEGSGEIELANATIDKRDASGRRLVFRPGEGPVFVRILSTDPKGTGDYLRNIRVYRKEHLPALVRGEIFNPDMLAYLAPFGSLRFMDWMESNQRGLCSGGKSHGKDCYDDDKCGGGGRCVMAGVWSERPRTDQPSLLARSQFLDPAHPERGVRVGGYPVELMVALANKLGADPHFNMPAAFEDEYAREFAGYVQKHLAPNLRASVEYSNETWNWGFPQAHYVHRLGRKLWPDEGSAYVQYAGSRMQHQCRLWKEVFGEEKQRVRCLLSPQTGWPDMARNMLDCPAWQRLHPELGACSEGADALAITGYFAGCLQERQNEKHLKSWLARGTDYALDKFFEQLENGGQVECAEPGAKNSLVDAIALYSVFGRMAESRGLELYVYESGTHFNYDGKDPAVERLFVAATKDPRMGQLYTRNLQAFKQAGGTIINAWGWVDPNDMWANSDSIIDHSHPKYRALRDFAKSEPCGWDRCDRSQR